MEIHGSINYQNIKSIFNKNEDIGIGDESMPLRLTLVHQSDISLEQFNQLTNSKALLLAKNSWTRTLQSGLSFSTPYLLGGRQM